MTRQHLLVAPALAVALLSVAPPARADGVDVGLRGGFYSDAEAAFVGVDLLIPVARSWFFNPNFEYVFVDRGDLYTLNADVHYDLDVRGSNYVWLGGGPALIVADPDRPRAERETDIGLNVLAGLGWKGASVVPYVQGKVVLADDTEAVLAFGVRF
jgi:hypothetical protein